jgi:hypothetical protein
MARLTKHDHPRRPSEGFKSLEEARKWVNEFVYLYNHEWIKFVTPNQRYDSLDIGIQVKRKALWS